MLVQELNNRTCKTYLVTCETSKKSLLIDPIKDNIARYLGLLAYKGYELISTIDTHTHADHETACFALSDLTGAKIIMGKYSPVPRVDLYVDDGEEIALGNVMLKVLNTPGHTPDSISLYGNNTVFTGDCLLIGGTGRADFAGGDAADQYDSITEKLFKLPLDTVVLPAHDYRGNQQSTIGEEKRNNPRIAGRSRKEYIDLMNNIEFPLPTKIQEVLQPNQTAIDDDVTKFPELAQLNSVMQLDIEDVNKQINSKEAPLILDVREKREFEGELGHIKDSKLIPLKELALRAKDELDPSTHIICICRSGVRSTTAAAILMGLGFEHIANMKGGMLDWNDKNLPIQ